MTSSTMEENSYTQLYGGLILETTEDKSSTSRPARAGRKTTPKSEDETKKNGKRGRPRVDPQDQSAIERRRTQIRLAQRAYRERKETSIAALEKRVAELQQTIVEMNQTFIDYRTKTVASGICNRYPELGENLRSTMERVMELSRIAEAMSDNEEESHAPKKPRRESKQNSNQILSARSIDLPTRSLSSSTPDVSPEQVRPIDMMGYQVTYDDGAALEPDPLQSILNQQSYTTANDRVAGWIDSGMQVQQYRAEVPDPSSFFHGQSTPNPNADKSLKPVYTYSFQETTFARRLLRSAYERTYRLLTNPNANPHEIQRILRYTLCYGDVKSVVNRLRQMLMRSKTESLENWSMPIWHIGGAGLHFPRSEGAGTESPPENWTDPMGVGPYRPRKRDVGVSDEGYPLNLIPWADVEGVWFDSYDVEQYLKTKGLHLDGSSSLAEMEIEESLVPSLSEETSRSPSDSSNSSLTGPSSPSNANEIVVDPFTTSVDYFLNPEIDLPSNIDIPMNDVNLNFDFEFGNVVDDKKTTGFEITQPAVLSANAGQHQPRTRRLLIDVDRLLENLNEKSVCLGRAPGYRQEDVDSALHTVIREAF